MGRYQAFDASMSIVQIANADYGTAGSPSADVHSFQGVNGGTPVKVFFDVTPLSTGAATSDNQATMITTLGNILTAIGRSTAPVQTAVSVGNTSIQLLGSSSARKKIQIQNQSPDYSVWLLLNKFSLTAATPDNNCWKLLPGEKYESDTSSIPIGFLSAISDAPTGSSAPVQIIES